MVPNPSGCGLPPITYILLSIDPSASACLAVGKLFSEVHLYFPFTATLNGKSLVLCSSFHIINHSISFSHVVNY